MGVTKPNAHTRGETPSTITKCSHPALDRSGHAQAEPCVSKEQTGQLAPVSLGLPICSLFGVSRCHAQSRGEKQSLMLPLLSPTQLKSSWHFLACETVLLRGWELASFWDRSSQGGLCLTEEQRHFNCKRNGGCIFRPQ